MMTDLQQSDGHYFDVNFFEYQPGGLAESSLPAAAIFEEATHRLFLDEGAINFAKQVRRFQGINKSLWGVRNEHGSYSVEFYFYYPKKYPKNKLSSVLKTLNAFIESDHELVNVDREEEYYLTSVNLDRGVVSDINVYRSIIDAESDVFCFHDKGFEIDRVNPRFASFSLWGAGLKPKKRNDYWGYFDGNVLHRVIAKVHDLAVKKYPDENPLKAYDFLMHSYSYSIEAILDNVLVADKESAIGLYFLHLNIDAFLSFLSSHAYEATFIDYMQENRDRFSHLLFDVGMDFYLSAGEFHIKKTAFWGSL